MTDPVAPTPIEPPFAPESPPSFPQPEIDPGGAPDEQPIYDPPADPGDWRPHDGAAR